MLEISEKIKELLREGLPKGKIKEFYVGIPAEVDRIITPSIAIETARSGEVTLGPTGMDELTYNGIVRVYIDKKQGISNQHSKGEPSPLSKADDIIFGIDMTGTYATYGTQNSVIGILRHHPFLSGATLNTQNTEVVYNTDISFQRVDESTDSLYIYEITFIGKMLVQVLTRS